MRRMSRLGHVRFKSFLVSDTTFRGTDTSHRREHAGLCFYRRPITVVTGVDGSSRYRHRTRATQTSLRWETARGTAVSANPVVLEMFTDYV
jgi:hypothetical protein